MLRAELAFGHFIRAGDTTVQTPQANCPQCRAAACWPGQEPVEITSGELFRVEFAGQLKSTLMEYNHADRQYYSVVGYPLRDGLRAAIGDHR